MRCDVQLAAALFFLLGEPMPHLSQREAEAAELRRHVKSGTDALRLVLDLCGEPRTPQEYYIWEKACSWLGGESRRELIRCAEAYLASSGWSSLPSGMVTEKGLQIDLTDRGRAGILSELAGALSADRRYEEAQSRYLLAFELEPYNAAHAVAAAAMLVRLGKETEAKDFLQQQKKSFYYRPAVYRDLSGRKKTNEEFRSAIDTALLKLTQENRES